MQIAHLRFCLGDEFPVQIKNDAENTVRRRVGGAEVKRHGLAEQFAGRKMCSMLLDGLLGAAQRVWCFVEGACAHGIELKTMKKPLRPALFEYHW